MYSNWSLKCPTSVVVKVRREVLEEIALKSVHGTRVGARDAHRFAEERARFQREPGCAITTSACLKHSSDRNKFVLLATSARRKHTSSENELVHLATSACLKHTSDGNLLVHVATSAWLKHTSEKGSCSAHQNSFNIGRKGGPLGSGCALRGKAPRISRLIRFTTRKLFQHCAYKWPSWKRLCAVRRGISLFEPDPAQHNKPLPTLGMQTAHWKWLCTARRGTSHVDPDPALAEQNSIKTGPTNGPVEDISRTL